MGSIPIISTILRAAKDALRSFSEEGRVDVSSDIIYKNALRTAQPLKLYNLKSIAKFYRTNNRITARKVRLIDPDGVVLGESVDIAEALQLASEKNLDLVEIAPTAAPPVCKIMDFGKFKYEKEREERLQRAKQKKTNELKGIRISFREGDHDLDFKKRSAVKFLNAGNKVKIDMTVKGREKAHFDLANQKMNSFIQKINEESPVSIEGRMQRGPRGLTVIISQSKK